MDENIWQQPDEIIEPVQENEPAKKEKESWQKTVLTYLHDLAFLLAGLILVFLLLFRVVTVSGDSMNHTLVDGDYLLLLNNVLYQDPQRGDIIVAKREGFMNKEKDTPIVKRVIATEGEWVDIRDGKVYVGNSKEEVEASKEPLVEDYTWEETEAYSYFDYPVQVEDNYLFVLGDNRGDSTDSRSSLLGFLSKNEVLGKVIFIIFPGNAKGEIERDFGRIRVVN